MVVAQQSAEAPALTGRAIVDNLEAEAVVRVIASTTGNIRRWPHAIIARPDMELGREYGHGADKAGMDVTGSSGTGVQT